jgi:uncharacterized membrane protein
VLPLIGILIVVVGFALRLNPLRVGATAAGATGIAAGHALIDVIAAFGKAFVDSRSVAVVWLALPVIGLLERAGLKERARAVISGIKVATTGRLLLAYLAVRQITSALGLTSLGGHPQMVRPLIAPMAEAAAENRLGQLSEKTMSACSLARTSSSPLGPFCSFAAFSTRTAFTWSRRHSRCGQFLPRCARSWCTVLGCYCSTARSREP